MTYIIGLWRVLLGSALLLAPLASARPAVAAPAAQAGIVWTRTDLNINPNKWSAAPPDASGSTRASGFSASGIAWTIDSPNNWNWTFEQTFTPPPDQVKAGTPFTVTLTGKAGGAKQNGGVGVGTGYRLQGFTADQVQVDQPQPPGALDIFVGRSGQGVLYPSATLTAKLTAPAAGDELALGVVSNGVVVWRAVYHKQPPPEPAPAPAPAPAANPAPEPAAATVTVCVNDPIINKVQAELGEPPFPLCPGVALAAPVSNPAECPPDAPDPNMDESGAVVLVAAQTRCHTDPPESPESPESALDQGLLGQDYAAFNKDLLARSRAALALNKCPEAYTADHSPGARQRFLSCHAETYASLTDADNHPLFPRIRALLPVLLVMARNAESDSEARTAFIRLLSIVLQQDKADWPKPPA